MEARSKPELQQEGRSASELEPVGDILASQPDGLKDACAQAAQILVCESWA